MTEQQLMAQTFFHTCTIKRTQEVTEGFITNEQLVVVYSNIQCAVSGGGTASTKTDEYIPLEYTDVLYTMPDIDVHAGDIVEANIFGDIVTFEAGEGRRYQSHRQTPLTRKGRA